MNVSSSGYEPAAYYSGNGTAYFIFLYTVQPGDHSGDLEYWDEQSLKTDGFIRRAADLVRTGTLHVNIDRTTAVERARVLANAR